MWLRIMCIVSSKSPRNRNSGPAGLNQPEGARNGRPDPAAHDPATIGYVVDIQFEHPLIRMKARMQIGLCVSGQHLPFGQYLEGTDAGAHVAHNPTESRRKRPHGYVIV